MAMRGKQYAISLFRIARDRPGPLAESSHPVGLPGAPGAPKLVDRDAPRRPRLVVAVLRPPEFKGSNVPSSIMNQPAASLVGLLTDLLTL
jgi:hypothetical protein